MSLYRRFPVDLHDDHRFTQLSRPQPCAQWLYVFLLTGRASIIVPGVVDAGEAALAEMLQWDLQEFRDCFQELVDKAMAIADWKARLVFLPDALAVNAPTPNNPNVVRAWRKAFDRLPECPLKDEILRRVKNLLKTFSEQKQVKKPKCFTEPFADVFPKDINDVSSEVIPEAFQKPLSESLLKSSFTSVQYPVSSVQESASGIKGTLARVKSKNPKANGHSGKVLSERDTQIFKIFRRRWEMERPRKRYEFSNRDRVQIVHLCNTLGITLNEVPDGWEQTVTNFLESPLESHKLHYLCKNHEWFSQGIVDPQGPQAHLLTGKQHYGNPGRKNGGFDLNPEGTEVTRRTQDWQGS